MEGNVGKSHLRTDVQHRFLIKSTNCEKPLDIKVYSKFKFDDHIETVCKTASNKIRILAIVIPHMIIENKCSIVAKTIIRLIMYMKDVFD